MTFCIGLAAFPLIVLFIMMPLLILMALISIQRLMPLRSYIFYFAVFLVFQAVLAAWGYAIASGRHQSPKMVSVTGEKVHAEGELIFLGSGHVALLDKAGSILVVNIDKGAVIDLGKFGASSFGSCVEYRLLQRLRNSLNVHCLSLHNP